MLSGHATLLVVLIAIAVASCNAACPLPSLQTDCVGLTDLNMTISELLTSCSMVPLCSSAVWGAGALVADLGVAVISQNLGLLQGAATISAICPPILALAANASTCVATASLEQAQALVLAATVRAAHLCPSGQQAEYLTVTGTLRCFCPSGQVCEPVHPSDMAFQVTMVILAFIVLLVIGYAKGKGEESLEPA